jgi:hypothetical protein
VPTRRDEEPGARVHRAGLGAAHGTLRHQKQARTEEKQGPRAYGKSSCLPINPSSGNYREAQKVREMKRSILAPARTYRMRGRNQRLSVSSTKASNGSRGMRPWVAAATSRSRYCPQPFRSRPSDGGP